MSNEKITITEVTIPAWVNEAVVGKAIRTEPKAHITNWFKGETVQKINVLVGVCEFMIGNLLPTPNTIGSQWQLYLIADDENGVDDSIPAGRYDTIPEALNMATTISNALAEKFATEDTPPMEE